MSFMFLWRYSLLNMSPVRKTLRLCLPCYAWHNLVPFVKFKKRGKHPWVLLLVKLLATKSNTPPWVFSRLTLSYPSYLLPTKILIPKRCNQNVVTNSPSLRLALFGIYSFFFIRTIEYKLKLLDFNIPKVKN